MRRILIDTQCKEGCAAGSWDPAKPTKDLWGDAGGRLMMTSLSALTLEVYFRSLPLYKLDRDSDEAAAAKPGGKRPAAKPDENGGKTGAPQTETLAAMMKKCPALIAVLLASVLTVSTAGVAGRRRNRCDSSIFCSKTATATWRSIIWRFWRRGPICPTTFGTCWDLEMAKSLLAAAGDAFDARDKEQLLRQAQEHLAKFIKEKPHHPAAAMAAVGVGRFSGEAGAGLAPPGERGEGEGRQTCGRSI